MQTVIALSVYQHTNIHTTHSSLDKVIATAQKAGLPRQEAHAHHTQGYTYQRKNDYVAARAAFEKALSLRQELGEQFRSFLTLTQLVEVCIRLADWPTAETHLLAAQQLYDTLQHDMPPYAHEMFHYAAFLYHKEQGDDSDTTKHLKQAYHALQTQLAEMDSAGREQMLNNPAAQTILSTMSDLNKDE